MQYSIFAADASSANTSSNVSQINVDGKVNLDLDYDGLKMMDNLQNATLSIENVSNLNNKNRLTLRGIVKYNNNSYPVSISSDLHKSVSSDNVIIGDSTDETTDFDVVYLAITNNISNSKIMTDKSLANSNVLQIYLLRKNTRELSMFEIPIDKHTSIKNVSSNYQYDNLSAIDNKNMSKEHWWTTVLKPVVTDTITHTPNTTTSDQISALSSPLAATSSAYNTTTDLRSYTYYNGPANCYKYTITLSGTGYVYDYGTSSNQTDMFTMVMSDQKYYYNNVLQPNYNFLKVFNLMATSVLTSSNSSPNLDNITLFTEGSSTTVTSGGWSVIPYLNVGTLVNLSLCWTPTTTVIRTDGPQVLVPARAGFKAPFVDVLATVNNSYSLTFVKNKVASSATRLSGTIFDFKIGFSTSDALGSGQLVLAATYN